MSDLEPSATGDQPSAIRHWPLAVGIVGCGLIGRRRAAVARELGDAVVIVADIDVARAQQAAHESGSVWTADWRGWWLATM